MLADPYLLALVLSGSYTEWVEAYRQPTWAAQLDSYAALIRGTDLPTLAICGTHQFLAYVYAGWGAVSHMAPAGQRPVAIAEEADGVFRAPDPRIGEIGVYACRAVNADPILEGLPELCHLVEYHHDQVLASELPPEATLLLAPDGLAAAQRRLAYPMAEVEVTPGQPRVACTPPRRLGPRSVAGCRWSVTTCPRRGACSTVFSFIPSYPLQLPSATRPRKPTPTGNG